MSLLIFCLASFLRIFNLGLIEFKYDEAYTVFQLTEYYQQPYLPQVGPPQSTGVYNFPLFNYLMIFLSLPSRSPQYLSFMIGLVNSLFVVVFYLFVRQFLGNLTAVFSAFLLAVSPWSVIFSRKIWIPDLLLPFSIPTLWLMCKLTIKKSTAIITLFILLTLIAQLHVSAMLFAVISFIIILIKAKPSWKQAALGIGLGLVPAIPYFYRQLTSSPFCIDCLAFINYQEAAKVFDFNNFIRPYYILGAYNFQTLLGADYPVFLNRFPIVSYLNILFLIEYFLPVLGIYFLVKYHRPYVFLLVYLLIFPLVYLITRTPSYMHYFVVISPIIMILAVLPFTYLRKPARFIWLILIIANLIFNIVFFRFLSVQKIINGDYGPIYSETEKFVNRMTDPYALLPYYNELRSYAFVFANTNVFSERLNEYLEVKNKAMK